ncbi:MAG TPA: FHA domain-containing protein [Coleofasciculaceae cyanobacterium]|jgi:pSer/pThr/pTyr-binding forkhead associated (FHA) protein
MKATRVQLGQLPKLLHLQSNTYIDLPLNLSVIHIGKPNERIQPNIDVSKLPNSDVVSRVHATIYIEGNTYFIEDLGSVNGTYLNQNSLIPRTRYSINIGDRIDLGKDNQVTFIFLFLFI